MAQNSPRTKVFISYSHADRRFLDRLHVFLKPLERERFIDWWDDTRIKPGDDWRKAIKDALDGTQVALLMLSPDFLASDFIDQDELPPLIEAAAEDHAVILQVVLGPINFGTWKLNNFQTINKPDRPLGKLRTRADRDEVWREVSNRIVEALKSGPIGTVAAERVAIEQTTEAIALIQRQSLTSSAVESEEDQQRANALLSRGSLASTDGGGALAKEPTPSMGEISRPIPLVESKLQGSTKAPAEQSRFSSIQIAWWRLIEAWDEFKSCRLSILAILAAFFFFVDVAQGTEILRAVGEGSATSPQWYWLKVFFFFFALLLWATCSWYIARVLFYFDFPERHQLRSTATWDNTLDFWQTILPRVLGVAPFLVVGLGFCFTSRAYPSHNPQRMWLLGFAGFCGILAIGFYLLMILRRRIIGQIPTRELQSIYQLDRSQAVELTAIGLICLISLLLFVAFCIAPVTVAHHLGPGTIVFLALSSWITLGGILIFVGSRWQIPVLTLLVFLAVLFSLWNDNHFIRVLPRRDVKRDDVLGSFQTWYDLVEKNYGVGTMHPLYIVAAEGGGIRAAYWTAIVLGALQDANPNFAPHLFAISGVGGGSLGAVVFDALLAEPARGSFQENVHKILTQDFLSPALGAMLYPDLVQRFIPFPIPYFDRGKSLEMGWEKAWRDTMGNNRLAGSFVDLWKPGVREWMPALFLNGTSVEKGNRIITSNLRVTNSFLDADDAAEKLAGHNLGATEAACNIPLSTAAHMSARFTFVSSAGRFPDGSHIVDGGYFDNSGATTAYEIVTRIKDWCAFKKVANVDVKVIMISNNPREPSIAPAKPAPEPPGARRTRPVVVSGQFMNELTAPLYTLLNTRDAHDIFAQKVIVREQRRFKAGVVEAPVGTESSPRLTKDFFYFKLRDTQVPLPLGWILPAAAAKTIREQINLDDDVVQNQSAMNEVLETLPPPR